MAIMVPDHASSLFLKNQPSPPRSNLRTPLFQLSSDSRNNSVADDAAGRAFANCLGANIAALDQTTQHANDGVGALRVAYGDSLQVVSLLNRAITRPRRPGR